LKNSPDREASDLNRRPDAVSTGRGVSYLWLQNIAISLSQVIAFAFFARLISVEDMGVFTILTLAYSAAGAFMSLGLPNIVTKFVAENVVVGNKQKAASVYYEALILTDLASILIAVVFLLSKFPAGVSHLPQSAEVSAISVVFAIDLAAYIGSVGGVAMLGLYEFKDYAAMYMMYGGLRPWLVVLLVYETRSLVGLVEAWIIADSVLAICQVTYLWRRLGPPVFKFDTKYLLKLSTPLYVSTIASFLYSSFDRLVLIPLVSLTALGVYGAVVTAFSAYISLISVFGTVLLPVFSGVHGAKGSDALVDSVGAASRYVAIVTMPIGFALLAAARPALTLLVGVGYAGGVIPLAVLALASICTIIAMALSPVLIVLNETLLSALTSLLPIPLSIVVALVSVPVLGIVGASIARGLSMLLSVLLTWYFVRRKIVVKLDSQGIMKSIAASGAMAFSMEALQLLYYSRLLLPLYLLGGASVYILAMRELRGINRSDIDLIREMLGSRFGGLCDLLSRLVVR
jgi:O-antigen/teichoic acid export membrane protein